MIEGVKDRHGLAMTFLAACVIGLADDNGRVTISKRLLEKLSGECDVQVEYNQIDDNYILSVNRR